MGSRFKNFPENTTSSFARFGKSNIATKTSKQALYCGFTQSLWEHAVVIFEVIQRSLV
jgi:hypothetical protein